MTNTTQTDFATIYAALTPRQRQAFDLIANGNDGMHNVRTLEKLLRLGLIESYEERSDDRPFPVTVRRYFVPVPVHMAWCEWCAENVEDEG